VTGDFASGVESSFVGYLLFIVLTFHRAKLSARGQRLSFWRMCWRNCTSDLAYNAEYVPAALLGFVSLSLR